MGAFETIALSVIASLVLLLMLSPKAGRLKLPPAASAIASMIFF